MKFVDQVVLYASSGAGGAGQMSFRREKFVPRGGPDGGDGGDGGALIIVSSPRRNTLVDYHRRPHQRAGDGVKGGKRQMNGARGQDLVLPVPVGTLIYDAETDELLADLATEGERWEIPGGKGGLGNIHFKSSTNRTPRQTRPPEPGTEMALRLELKLIADVGLLGFPNAGKSTFLSTVSAARPKVADYPFTTLVPSLGVVRLEDEQTFVVADIPGLIDGAAEGAGLGHQFLRHVERCGCYIHLVAIDPMDERAPEERFAALNDELKAYESELFERPQIVALNKTDLVDAEELAELVAALEAVTGSRVFPVSNVTGEGIPALVGAVWQVLQHVRPQPVEDDATP
jgi:GTP-binding protein